jgi:hypothetical protein
LPWAVQVAMMFQLWIVGRDDGGGIGFFHVGIGVSLLCLFIWCHRFWVGGRDISSDCMVIESRGRTRGEWIVLSKIWLCWLTETSVELNLSI